MRQAVHFLLNAIGLVPWLLSMLLLWVVLGLSRLGHWVQPASTMGNCWAYCLPRWHRGGGYLLVHLIRLRSKRVPWIELRVPHVSWVPGEPGEGLERTSPVVRATSLGEAWGGIRVAYFRFRVIDREPEHLRWPGTAAIGPGPLARALRWATSEHVTEAALRAALLLACGLLTCAAVTSVFVGLVPLVHAPGWWFDLFTTLPGGPR